MVTFNCNAGPRHEHEDRPNPMGENVIDGIYVDRAPGGHRHHQRLDRALCCRRCRPRARPPAASSAQTTSSRSGWVCITTRASPGRFPRRTSPAIVNGAFFYNGFSVHARILPFMEQGVAFNSINFSFTHRTVQNSTVVGLALTCFLCPSDPNMDGLTAFPSGVNARVPCYGFNEGDWFIWNALVHQRHQQRTEQPRRLRPQPEPADRRVHRRHQPDPLRHRRQGPQPVLPGRWPVLGGEPELADGSPALRPTPTPRRSPRNTPRSPPATPSPRARDTPPGSTATPRRPG